jgi:hypothetical protein
MPKYIAYASYVTDLSLTFEAKDDEDARRIVLESDGGDWKDITGPNGDWNNEGLLNIETQEWVDEP